MTTIYLICPRGTGFIRLFKPHSQVDIIFLMISIVRVKVSFLHFLFPTVKIIILIAHKLLLNCHHLDSKAF